MQRKFTIAISAATLVPNFPIWKPTCDFTAERNRLFVHSASTLAIKLAGLKSTCESTLEKSPIVANSENIPPQGHIFSKGTCSLKKPFHCTHCTSSFTQKGHFKKQMSTHSGERRFSCDQCSYSCIQANDIKKHMPQHSGEKPFDCNQCSFSCRRPSGLKILHAFPHWWGTLCLQQVRFHMQGVSWFEEAHEKTYVRGINTRQMIFA